MQDLSNWEASLSSKPKPAVKSSSAPSIKPQKIRSFDYAKWDKFDIEEALDQVDISHAEDSIQPIKSSPINVFPEEAIFEKEKGNLYFKKGKFKKAVLCYTKSIEFDCNSAAPLVNRSLTLIKLKMFKEATCDATKALDLEPKNIKALWRRGIAQIELKLYVEARKVY